LNKNTFKALQFINTHTHCTIYPGTISKSYWYSYSWYKCCIWSV